MNRRDLKKRYRNILNKGNPSRELLKKMMMMRMILGGMQVQWLTRTTMTLIELT